MLDGYDPVAYFTGKPSKGKSTWLASYEGVTYAFKSLENKQKFLQSPQMFVPQYGGWCAYAMGATGEKVEVDPETFKIVDGKLYLFYNSFFNNTLPKWNENEKELKGKADANWSKFLKSK